MPDWHFAAYKDSKKNENRKNKKGNFVHYFYRAKERAKSDMPAGLAACNASVQARSVAPVVTMSSTRRI